MKAKTLREWIREAGAEWRMPVDAKLEDFIFEVASKWADRRVKVEQEIRAGTYKDE